MSNSVNQGDTFQPLLSNFALEYTHMKSKTRRRGWSLMVNIIKTNSYLYTVRYWGGCSGGGHEEITCVVVFCMTVSWIYIYIYIYMCVCVCVCVCVCLCVCVCVRVRVRVCCILPSDLLPYEGIKLYSSWETVNAKLKNYVIWWRKKD